VVFSQNHDQAGNRARGERLSALTGREQLKLAASAVLLSPYVPLLFMGEEYGELSPFLYFVSFGDRALADAVFEGRIGAFGARAAVPDPQAAETFLESKLAWERRREGGHANLCAFYKALIALRKKTPALSTCYREGMCIFCDERTLTVCFVRTCGGDAALCCLNFNSGPAEIHILLPGSRWKKLLDSAEAQWLGPGPDQLAGPDAVLPMQPFSAAVFSKER
jgi:maltooligosyltrehalose trehalohydrolase